MTITITIHKIPYNRNYPLSYNKDNAPNKSPTVNINS